MRITALLLTIILATLSISLPAQTQGKKDIYHQGWIDLMVVYTHELTLETYEVAEARRELLDEIRNAEFAAWLKEQTS